MEMSKKKEKICCFETNVYFLEFMFLLGASFLFFLACSKTTSDCKKRPP
jgi:hypothetical protein